MCDNELREWLVTAGVEASSLQRVLHTFEEEDITSVATLRECWADVSALIRVAPRVRIARALDPEQGVELCEVAVTSSAASGDDPLAPPPPSRFTLLRCVACVWLFWSCHDFLQERIFHIHGFHFGVFMSFGLQSVSALLVASVQAWRAAATRLSRDGVHKSELESMLKDDGTATDEEGDGAAAAPPPVDRVRLAGWYLLLCCLIAAANGAASAALNFVSMPIKVVFKSSKLILVLLLGALFGRYYRRVEYGCMMLAAAGLVLFFLAGSPATGGAAAALPGSAGTGASLLIAAVAVDALVPNVQQVLLQDMRRPRSEVVLHTNVIAALLTLTYLVATGGLVPAVSFVVEHPLAGKLLLVQSVAGYCGIQAYLETVEHFGSKVTTLVTSCRKLFTIGLSALAFRHPLVGFHFVGTPLAALPASPRASLSRCRLHRRGRGLCGRGAQRERASRVDPRARAARTGAGRAAAAGAVLATLVSRRHVRVS